MEFMRLNVADPNKNDLPKKINDVVDTLLDPSSYTFHTYMSEVDD